MLQKIIRRIKPQILPNIIGAQGLCDLRVAGSRCIPYTGCVGISNLGDEAMFEIANRSFPFHRLVAAKYKPLFQRMVLEKCSKMRLGILVGGGTAILSDSLLLTLEHTSKYETPFVTFGSGVLDPEYWGTMRENKRQRWLRVFQRCVALGVRGPISKRILEDMGILNARVVGDPAILYTRNEFSVPSSGKVLGINIGTSYGRVWGNDEEEPVQRLADALRQLQADGWGFRFFCVWPRDLASIHHLIACARIKHADIVEEYYSAERFLDEVAVCRVFVGMKLHAVILSVCAGVATLALEYRPKLRDFMASIKSESKVLRFDQYEASTLASAIETLCEEANIVAMRQWKASQELSQVFSKYVHSLNGIIHGWKGLG